MTSYIHKRQYHPYIPLAFHLQILPQQALLQIPRSTKYYWRKKELHSLSGAEYANSQDEFLNTLSLIARNKQLLSANKALLKVIALIKFVIKYKGAIKAGRSAINSCLLSKVKDISSVIGFHKTLKWIGFSYSQWRRITNKQLCAHSPFLLCRRKHPAQLLTSEITTLTNACYNQTYKAWPLSSIYHQLIRTNQLYCSLGSFYKYCAKLVIRPNLPKSRRTNHSKGIRAEKPLQILHADITLFKTIDGTQYYIYFIQDNLSRAVLQYSFSNQKLASTLIMLIKKVYEQFLQENAESPILLTDGGAENKLIAKEFANTIPPLEHLIAQKDVIFSNSMIEHLNKTIKYRYLYQQQIENGQILEKILDQAIDNYNNRPVHILQGLTPLEVLKNTKPNLQNIKENIQQAAKTRIFINRSDSCCI
jgi:putative transposase